MSFSFLYYGKALFCFHCHWSVPKSYPTLCEPTDCSTPDLPVHHQLPELALNSCPSCRWCHPTISSSSVVPFSSCLQSFPASGSFLMSQLFTSEGQGIGTLASPSMNIQDWFPLGWTGLMSLLSNGLSRVFSSTRIQKHQLFRAQPALWSNSHIHTRLLEKL